MDSGGSKSGESRSTFTNREAMRVIQHIVRQSYRIRENATGIFV